jgi:hypothetical protein
MNCVWMTLVLFRRRALVSRAEQNRGLGRRSKKPSEGPILLLGNLTLPRVLCKTVDQGIFWRLPIVPSEGQTRSNSTS